MAVTAFPVYNFWVSMFVFYLTKNFEQPFKNLVGTVHHVRKTCENIGKNWVHGISQCEKLFSSA